MRNITVGSKVSFKLYSDIIGIVVGETVAVSGRELNVAYFNTSGERRTDWCFEFELNLKEE